MTTSMAGSRFHPCLGWGSGFVVLLAFCAAGQAAESAWDDSTQPEAKAKTLSASTIEGTVDMVHWLSRRRQLTVHAVPYGFTGLPILYLSPFTGWNYGAHLQWTDLRRRPYRYKMIFHWARSTEGKAKYYAALKVPTIRGTGFGVYLQAILERDIRTRYYGLGNESVYNQRYTDPKSPVFRDEDYYHYILKRPRLIFLLLHPVYGPVSLATGFGLERTAVSQRGESSFYVDAGTPDGVVDGPTGFVSLTLQWDTRDDEVIPQTGVFHEWSYETSRNSLMGLFFEQINFRRYTFTDARYYLISDRIDLARRTVFEILDGEVPLYAYGEIGGSRRIKGLGGGDSLRGYDSQRFTDKVRFFTNTELRYLLARERISRQHLEWHGVFFVDTGRVWPNIDQITASGMHWTAGLGLRLYWNADFVIRLDTGFSSEQPYVTLKYRNIF